jgi:hypothetical protein
VEELLKIGDRAAIAIGGGESLAGWKLCSWTEPNVPLLTAQRTRSTRSAPRRDQRICCDGTAELGELGRNEGAPTEIWPQPVLHAGDGDRDFVETRCIAELQRTSTNAAGEVPPEFLSPVSDGLVADDDSSRREHVLDHAKVERKEKITTTPPDRLHRRESGTGVQTIARLPHAGQLSPNGENAINLTAPFQLAPEIGAELC